MQLPERTARHLNVLGGPPPEISDGLGRSVSYVRISITDRCDMACVYCMPPEGERLHLRSAELLTAAEIARLANVLAAQGVARVRFTGGEPLCRKDVLSIVRETHRRAPGLALAMTTNGSRLGSLARPLRDAGLGSVNVSLDSLDPDRFAAITRGGELTAVLKGIDAALAAGFEVKTNTVVLGARGRDEIEPLVRWAWAHSFTPRFIELMPIGEGALLPADELIPGTDIEAQLARIGLVPADGIGFAHGPARYWSVPGAPERRVGVIAATSRPFCSECNRARVGAGGAVQPCLARSGTTSLVPLLRSGASDDGLIAAFRGAVRSKSEGHEFARVDGTHCSVSMSRVGG